MKIKEIKTQLIPIQLNAPFKTALREVNAVDVIRVKIYFDNGVVGIGEAAPTKAITGDTEASILKTINESFSPFLIGKEVDGELTILDEMKQLVSGQTSPKAAMDIALFDGLAKAAKQPLYRYLGGNTPQLTTDFTISIASRKKMVADGVAKVNDGFTSLKIKLGLDDVAEEVAKIRCMNEALEGKIPFRIDANQGWTKEEAVQILAEWQDIPIDFVEQPVKAHDFAALKYVTERSTIPIMADESLFGFTDAKKLLEEQCCDLLNIKLMKSSGIKEAIQIFQLAQHYRIPCMVGSMIEGYGGMAAAAHFAVGMKDMAYCDLDVPFMWQQTADLAEKSGLHIRPGNLVLTDGIGLGIK